MGKNKNKQKRNPPKNGFQSAHAPAADTNRNNREEPNMSFATESGPENVVTIKVVGVGGAGNNVVNRMVKSGTQGIEYVAVNTDKQALAVSSADQKIQIGEKLTHGQGAGSDPDVGKRSAEESRNNIAKSLENADMVFITAGMGGGTGTGAAPTIADIAREAGILTVGVVTKPFKFEGKRRMDQAMVGINELLGKVDSLLIIPNDRLKFATDQKVTLANAFEIADDVLRQAVVSISDLIKNTGFINLDFADVTCVMKDAGFAHMGVGRAAGKGKAEDAARMAVASPLMETSINGARGVLINITNPCDIVTRELALHLGLPRGRVFGTGTGLDTSRLLSALARQTGLDHKSITCYMMGEHGNQQFAPWSCVSFRGVPLDEWAKTDERFRFDRDALQKESIGGGWVTFSGKFCTEYGIATTAARMAYAVLHDEKVILPASTELCGEYGEEGLFAGVPCVIGENGVEQVVELPLTADEKATFHACCEGIRHNMEHLKEI